MLNSQLFLAFAMSGGLRKCLAYDTEVILPVTTYKGLLRLTFAKVILTI